MTFDFVWQYLTGDQWAALAILCVTLGLIVSAVVRSDVVAVLVVVMIGLTRALPPEKLFSGFSSEAVISSIGIMIVSAGLEKSGIAMRAARFILEMGDEKPERIVWGLMVVSAILSGFLRSLGTVALLLPVVTRLSLRTGIAKARLLLPMGFCAMLGSGLTMIGTSPLIMLNGLLDEARRIAPSGVPAVFRSFHLLDVLPFGLIALCGGFLILWYASRFLLPQKESLPEVGAQKAYFLKTYGKGGDIFELRLLPQSVFVGKSLKDIEEQMDICLSVIGIWQDKELHMPPLRRLRLEAHCALAIMGARELVSSFAEQYGLRLMSRLQAFSEVLHPTRSGLCEAVIPPSSSLIGQPVRELHMRRNHHLQVLALYRDNTVYRGQELNDLNLKAGDTLGLYSAWEVLADFHKHPDFAVVTSVYPQEEINPSNWPKAVLFFALSVLLVLWGHFPISLSFLVGASLMIAFKVLSVDEAYRAVSWQAVFLLAGLIPLGLLMQSTGLIETLVQSWHGIAFYPKWVVQGVLMILSMGLSWVVTSVGATVLLVPIAVQWAFEIGADPRLFALIVALSSSNGFLFPSNQINALIAGPGGYRQKDFYVVGGMMSLSYGLLILGVLPHCL